MFQTIKNTATSPMCRTSEDSLGLSDPLLSSLICSSLAYPACYPTHRGTHFDPTYFNIKLVRPCNHLCIGGTTTKCLANIITVPPKKPQALSAPRRVALRLRTWHRRQWSLDFQAVPVSLDGCNTGENQIMHWSYPSPACITKHF